MDAAIEQATKAVASDVLQEAVKEVTGRSNRKWGVIVVAFVLGAVVGGTVGLVLAARVQSSRHEEPG